MSWTPNANLEVFDVLGQFEVKSTPTVTILKTKPKESVHLFFVKNPFGNSLKQVISAVCNNKILPNGRGANSYFQLKMALKITTGSAQTVSQCSVQNNECARNTLLYLLLLIQDSGSKQKKEAKDNEN